MTDNSDVKKLVVQLEKAIKDGLNLFKIYKKMSKEFQEGRKILTNNKDFEKDLKNKINSIKLQRNKLFKKTEENKNMPNKSKAAKLLELANEEKRLKSKEYRQEYKNMVEKSLVNSNKKFLKEKEHIRKLKKIILSKIKKAFSQLKNRMSDDDFKQLEKDIRESPYQISNNKAITFQTLMNHLKSGEISEEVAKTTKQIDELMTIGNVVNRKKRMEIGIKQKEIEKLVKNYEKTNKLSKESVKKEIKKLVKSLNGISDAKKKEEVTTKIDRLSRSLKNEMTERQRKIKYDIKTKMQELNKLQESS